MAVLTPRNAGGGLALLPCSIVRDDLDEAVTEEGPLRCGHLRAMYATGRLPLTGMALQAPHRPDAAAGGDRRLHVRGRGTASLPIGLRPGSAQGSASSKARLKITRELQLFFSSSRPDALRRSPPTLSAVNRERTGGWLYSTLPVPRRRSASICNRVPPPKRAR